MIETKPALLLLEDGNPFQGNSLGYEGSIAGEAVSNTSMTGWQVLLSSPFADWILMELASKTGMKIQQAKCLINF